MGMCMCSFMTVPCLGVGAGTSGILWCVGDGKCDACCGCRNDLLPVFTPRQKALHLSLWLLVFLIGLLALFLPMSRKCAKADGVPWGSFDWLSEGECWSEGGSGPGANLGTWAGIFCGIGAGGFLLTCCRCTTRGESNGNDDSNDPPSETNEKTAEIDV